MNGSGTDFVTKCAGLALTDTSHIALQLGGPKAAHTAPAVPVGSARAHHYCKAGNARVLACSRWVLVHFKFSPRPSARFCSNLPVDHSRCVGVGKRLDVRAEHPPQRWWAGRESIRRECSQECCRCRWTDASGIRLSNSKSHKQARPWRRSPALGSGASACDSCEAPTCRHFPPTSNRCFRGFRKHGRHAATKSGPTPRQCSLKIEWHDGGAVGSIKA